MDSATLFWLSFLAGIYAPVGSPCAIILYPGYLSFLAGRPGDDRAVRSPLLLGCAVAAGVIVSMLAGGLIFMGLLDIFGGGTRVIITAVLFLVLLVFSLFLILGIDPGRYGKSIPVPRPEKPLPAAFFLGLTFGIIIIPCNAAVIVVLLALASSARGFIDGIGSFLCFGFGVTLPLIVLAGLSQVRSRQLTGFLQHNLRLIQVVSGMVMLAISLWYLGLLFFPGLF